MPTAARYPFAAARYLPTCCLPAPTPACPISSPACKQPAGSGYSTSSSKRGGVGVALDRILAPPLRRLATQTQSDGRVRTEVFVECSIPPLSAFCVGQHFRPLLRGLNKASKNKHPPTDSVGHVFPPCYVIHPPTLILRSRVRICPKSIPDFRKPPFQWGTG